MAAPGPPANQFRFDTTAGDGFNDNFSNGQQANFEQNILTANDFGFDFTRIVYNPPNNTKGSFVVNIEFFNQVPGQQQPFATWQLTLQDLLDADFEFLTKRSCADFKKDLMCATTSLSANGAIETLIKFMRGVFRDEILRSPLQLLLHDVKDYSPPPGEIIVKGVLSSPGHYFAIPDGHLPMNAIYFRDSGPKANSVDGMCRENPFPPPPLPPPLPPPPGLTVDVVKIGRAHV